MIAENHTDDSSQNLALMKPIKAFHAGYRELYMSGFESRPPGLKAHETEADSLTFSANRRSEKKQRR